MNKKWLLMSLWSATCTLATSSLLGFNGHGFNDLTQIYQWDSGKHSSVFSRDSARSIGFPPEALQGDNSQSIAQGFDTRHRDGACADVITAVQFGFADIVDSYNSYQCREGRGSLPATPVSTAGLTVTIGIWPGTVAAGNQRRTNAIYLQDYTIQPASFLGTEPSSADPASDIGITSNFQIACEASYSCPDCCLAALEQPGWGFNPCGPCVQDVEEQGCTGITGAGCIFPGNGSNIRPPVAPYVAQCEGCTGCTGCTGCIPCVGCQGCTACACSDGVCPFPPTNGVCLLEQQDHIRRPEAPCQHTGQDGRNPFSEYGTAFTTVVLDQAVKVTGEFWVGVLVPIPSNVTLQGPNDDVSTSVLGISVVDFDAPQPQPNGIDLSGLLRFDGTCCLENNVDIAVTPANPDALHPIANGYTPIPSTFFTAGNFGNKEDEFFAIRAIPKNSQWWTLNDIPRAQGCHSKKHKN